MKSTNSLNPFESLDRIELELLSEEKLEHILNDYNLNDSIPSHKLFKEVCRYWINEYHWNLISNEKQINCLKGKIEEFLFVEESKELDIPFDLELNWHSPFDYDLILKKKKNHLIPVEYKKQRISFHPYKRNAAGVTFENFLTLRKDQIPNYIKEGLPLILIDRDLDFESETVQNAQSFAKNSTWHEGTINLHPKRSLHLIDVDTLALMIEKNSGFVNLNIHEKHRGKHNGKNFNGNTIGFNANNFPFYHIGGSERDDFF